MITDASAFNSFGQLDEIISNDYSNNTSPRDDGTLLKLGMAAKGGNEPARERSTAPIFLLICEVTDSQGSKQ